MSGLDRLHDIIDALPPPQVHALLTLLAPTPPISDEDSARRSPRQARKKWMKGPSPASWPPKPNTERISLTAN